MYDDVNKPRHYNVHPSKVEAIEVTEWLMGNLANATKYLWRSGDKEATPVRDLRKASWYLDREVKRLTKVGVSGATFPDRIRPIARRVNQYEPEGSLLECLMDLLQHESCAISVNAIRALREKVDAEVARYNRTHATAPSEG